MVDRGFRIRLFLLNDISQAFHTARSADSICVRFLEGSPRTFEQTGGDGSENKTADVGQVRDTASLHPRDSAGVDKLNDEPKTNQERGRNERDSKKYKNEQHRLDPIPGIGHDEGAHHGSDGSA